MTSQGYSARPVCFFADWPGAGPCDGELIRAHLIPKQRIRREMRARLRGGFLPSPEALTRAIAPIVWDPRVWVPMCGGPMGNAGHHGRYDSRAGHRNALVIPRAKLPAGLEEFAEEYGLGWSLERDYGPKEDVA